MYMVDAVGYTYMYNCIIAPTLLLLRSLVLVHPSKIISYRYNYDPVLMYYVVVSTRPFARVRCLVPKLGIIIHVV